MVVVATGVPCCVYGVSGVVVYNIIVVFERVRDTGDRLIVFIAFERFSRRSCGRRGRRGGDFFFVVIP